MDASESESSAGTEAAPLGCLEKIVYGIAWILLFGFTLGGVGSFVSEQLVPPRNQEGYGALLGIGGVFLFMPLGLFASFIVLEESKRRWVFFAMAVVLAAAIAFGAAGM